MNVFVFQFSPTHIPFEGLIQIKWNQLTSNKHDVRLSLGTWVDKHEMYFFRLSNLRSHTQMCVEAQHWNNLYVHVSTPVHRLRQRPQSQSVFCFLDDQLHIYVTNTDHQLKCLKCKEHLDVLHKNAFKPIGVCQNVHAPTHCASSKSRVCQFCQIALMLSTTIIAHEAAHVTW